MEIAKGIFTFSYDDSLNPLPDEDKIKDGMDLATEKLKDALMLYVSSIASLTPSGHSIDIDIHLFGNAGDVVKIKIDGEEDILQRKDGHAYILKTDRKRAKTTGIIGTLIEKAPDGHGYILKTE